MSFVQLLDSRPDGVVLSPSQIGRYDECNTRWAIENIGGVKPPPHPSAKLGTQVHNILERWLSKGVPPDVKTKQGRIAMKMIAHLPPPGTGAVERRFYFTTRNGVSYTGFIDWSGIFHDWPTVIDHKTTGDLKWAKTEAALHNDVQALTYTIAGCYGFEIDTLQLMWGYGLTKGKNPETKPVRTRIHLPVVEAQFDQILDPYGQEIVWHKEHPKHPLSYPRNLGACDDYGGCPHRDLCQITEAERIEYLMNMPAQTSLANRLSGPGFAPPGAQPQNGTAPGAYAPPGGAPAGYPPPQGGYPVPQGSYPAPGGYPAPPGGAPGGYPVPGGPFTPPQAPGAPPGGFAPPGGTPPNTQPQQGFAPPMGQQPMVYPGQAGQPGQPGPNAPESGQGTQLQAPEPVKKGRGRPRKDQGDGATAEAMRQASVGISLGGAEERVVFMHGMTAMMQSAQWGGTPEQLQWAGQMAVHAYRMQFPVG